MSCLGCEPTARERAEKIKSVYKEAKAYAVRETKMAVIYEPVPGKILWMEWEAARASGVQPIQYVTYLQERIDG